VTGLVAGTTRVSASNWRRSRLASLLTPGRSLLLHQGGRIADDHQDFLTVGDDFLGGPLAHDRVHIPSTKLS